MRVEYRVGLGRRQREWICFEHPRNGFARRKAEQWWTARSREPVPDTVDEAIELANAGALAPTLTITVERRAGDKYDRIVGHTLGDRPPRLDDPDAVEHFAGASLPDDGIPF
jgi:DNA repair protein RadD